MIILGINGEKRQHNSAASVLIDGKLIASVEEERISRIKSDSAYPHRAIAEVLSIAGITDRDVDMIALSNLSRWDQKPCMDRFFRQVARLGKTEPLIKNFYWKHQFERYARILRPRKKPAGILAQNRRKPSSIIRRMPHRLTMHRPMETSASR